MSVIILVAFGLAMDCLAVSITSGITIRHPRMIDAVKIAVSFGSFQMVMPLIGWLAGLGLTSLITGIDHWIAFLLLILIGCKMIYESIKTESSRREFNPLNLYILLTLSVTTSIDALAVGVGFAFLKILITIPIIVIGTMTFTLSFLGVFIGNRFGNYLGNRAGIVGGFILIGVGTKILVEHLA